MPRHTVFMSHAHADNNLCKRYADALRDCGFDVWIDISNGQTAGSLPDNITTQLVRRSALVLMLTRTSNTSLWVGHELDNFIAYAYDPSMRMVNGLERVVLPVFLEEQLPPLVDGRASNSAKVRGEFRVDAARLSFNETVAKIAHALNPSGNAPQASVLGPARSLPHTPIGGWPLPGTQSAIDTLWSLPGTLSAAPDLLDSLGFAGRYVSGVEVIIPPMSNVPAGEFLMGSAKNKDREANDDETPQFRMPLDHSYQIGTYPVTVAEYAYAVRAQAVREPPDKPNIIPWGSNQLQHMDHPVVNISWQDALAYARWLAEVTGQPWRLPTEVEWEKAGRGTDGRIYPWGSQWDEARANTSESGPGMTTPVGAYAGKGDASPYGAHDMVGNVWEWTSSHYRPYPYNPSDGRENLGSLGGRVLRGSSWLNDRLSARVACRGYDEPDKLSANRGFRLVRGAGG